MSDSKSGCIAPKAKPQVFNADFLMIAIASVTVYTYFMVYTIIFLSS
ncbi:MAG: hypothetical protein V1867_07615 [Candidatus Falkowbacteria bacterium]